MKDKVCTILITMCRAARIGVGFLNHGPPGPLGVLERIPGVPQVAKYGKFVHLGRF